VIQSRDMASREAHIHLTNATKFPLRLREEHHCWGEWTEGRKPPALIEPGATVSFSSESDGFMTGTEGWVIYTFMLNLKAGIEGEDLYIYWDTPFANTGGDHNIIPKTIAGRAKGSCDQDDIEEDGETPDAATFQPPPSVYEVQFLSPQTEGPGGASADDWIAFGGFAPVVFFLGGPHRPHYRMRVVERNDGAASGLNQGGPPPADQANGRCGAFLRSTFGKTGNLELVVPQARGLLHCWRDEDDPARPWQRGQHFGQRPARVADELGPRAVSAAMTQSRARAGDGVRGDFELVVRSRPAFAAAGDRLLQWTLDAATLRWGRPRALVADGTPVGGVTGTPSLLSSSFGARGNDELFVPQGDAVVHYWRDNDAEGRPWHRGASLSYRFDPTPNQRPDTIRAVSSPAAVAAIQSNFRGDGRHGNYELIVRVARPVSRSGDTLDFWFFDSDGRAWHGPFPVLVDGAPIVGVTGDPAFFQSTWGTKGNFELLVPQGDAVVHYWRDNDEPGFPWRRGAALSYAPRAASDDPTMATNVLNAPMPVAVTAIQGPLKSDGVHGDLEAVVRVRVAAIVAEGEDRLDTWRFDGASRSWLGPVRLRAGDAEVRTPALSG
jgi:hypothetical protein